MAIKVRCQQCRKKISIDEAFAGGLCRCPYCKAITMVSGGPAVVAHADRPDAPTEVAVAQARQVASAEAVPLAKPVMIQGIVAIVMSGLVLLLLVVGVVLVAKISTGLDKPPAPNGGMAPVTNGTNGTNGTDVNGDDNDLPPMPDPTNPFTAGGLQVAGMGIAQPVVYVIDASSGMRDLYDPAVAVVRYSIRTMGRLGQFNVIVLADEQVKPLADAWITGGEAGDTKAKDFLRTCQPVGATDLAGGLRRAMAMKPSTVVVLSGKAVGGADELAKQAKQTGVGIFAVMLEAPPDAVKVMEKLAAATSGQCRQFTSDELVELFSEVPPLP